MRPFLLWTYFAKYAQRRKAFMIEVGLRLIELDGESRTYAGCPGTGTGLEPRYIIPALAKALGGKAADWEAASWVVLSSVMYLGDARKYWYDLWHFAREERSYREE